MPGNPQTCPGRYRATKSLLSLCTHRGLSIAFSADYSQRESALPPKSGRLGVHRTESPVGDFAHTARQRQGQSLRHTRAATRIELSCQVRLRATRNHSECSASASQSQSACLRGPGSRARGGQGSEPCESRGPRPRPRPHHHPAAAAAAATAAAAAAAAAALTRVYPKAHHRPRLRPEWRTRFHPNTHRRPHLWHGWLTQLHPNTHRRPHLRRGWLTRVHPKAHRRSRLRNGWSSQRGPSTLAALSRTSDQASARWVSAPRQRVSAWRR